MKFLSYSKNGKVLPLDQAVYPLTSLEFAYGFGVYENIKVRNGVVYFLPQHVNRLFHSANVIGLQHQYRDTQIQDYILEFAHHISEGSYNLKLLLIGAETKGQADFIILPSSPYFPKRQWYRDGVKVISYQYERWKPQAKTLNMLPSYVIYKEASAQGAYDALLYDGEGNVREGTRTNVYLTKGKQIFSPPKKDVLEGVTMMSLEKVIEKTDYSIIYSPLPFSSIFDYDGMFMSSTSSKIIPVRQIDEKKYEKIPEELLELIKLYEESLDRCEGKFERL